MLIFEKIVGKGLISNVIIFILYQVGSAKNGIIIYQIMAGGGGAY